MFLTQQSRVAYMALRIAAAYRDKVSKVTVLAVCSLLKERCADVLVIEESSRICKPAAFPTLLFHYRIEIGFLCFLGHIKRDLVSTGIINGY